MAMTTAHLRTNARGSPIGTLPDLQLERAISWKLNQWHLFIKAY